MLTNSNNLMQLTHQKSNETCKRCFKGKITL